MGMKELRALIEEQVRQRQLRERPPPPKVGKPLKNARHELFVWCILAGMTCKEAHLKCGYSTHRASVKGNAGKTRWRPKVAARIEELQEYQAEMFMRAMLAR